MLSGAVLALLLLASYLQLLQLLKIFIIVTLFPEEILCVRAKQTEGKPLQAAIPQMSVLRISSEVIVWCTGRHTPASTTNNNIMHSISPRVFSSPGFQKLASILAICHQENHLNMWKEYKEVMHTNVVQKYCVSHKKLEQWGQTRMHRKKSLDAVCLWPSLFCNSKRGGTEAGTGKASNILSMKDTGEKTERKTDFGLL